MLSMSEAPQLDSEICRIAHCSLVQKAQDVGLHIRKDPKQVFDTTRQVWASKFGKPDPKPQPDQYETKIMNGWVFAETSVTVQCKRYIFAITLICCVILCGGIAIPYAVKNRITAVDPFQITTFTWLLVGSILITAKGRYVSEWPWHDFIHGSVVCKSVNDLAEVTGVREQTILAKLLYDERQTTLITRGPYNGMFVRKAYASAPGFSIDVPIRSPTMFFSGFIIFKVLSNIGEHLIVLDARKGSASDSANKSEYSVKYLSCLDLRNDFKKTDIGMTEPGRINTYGRVLYLTQNELRWTNILGLYIRESYFG